MLILNSFHWLSQNWFQVPLLLTKGGVTKLPFWLNNKYLGDLLDLWKEIYVIYGWIPAQVRETSSSPSFMQQTQLFLPSFFIHVKSLKLVDGTMMSYVSLLLNGFFYRFSLFCFLCSFTALFISFSLFVSLHVSKHNCAINFPCQILMSSISTESSARSFPEVTLTQCCHGWATRVISQPSSLHLLSSLCRVLG